jgi:hypothetical protein
MKVTTWKQHDSLNRDSWFESALAVGRGLLLLLLLPFQAVRWIFRRFLDVGWLLFKGLLAFNGLLAVSLIGLVLYFVIGDLYLFEHDPVAKLQNAEQMLAMQRGIQRQEEQQRANTHEPPGERARQIAASIAEQAKIVAQLRPAAEYERMHPKSAE